MWFSDVQHQFNRMMIPGRVSVKPSIEKEFMSYLKLLLSMMGQVRHEVHIGEFRALTQWLPDFFERKTGIPSKLPFLERLDLQPFEGEAINWVEYYDGISVCLIYMVDGDIITVFPIFQMPHDQEWWPSTVFATICNGKTFRQELGDGPESRDKRKKHSIPDDMLDKQVNIRIIGNQNDIAPKVFDFHNKIVEQAIIVLEEYGILLSKDWTVMGEEVLARAERRLTEREGNPQVERRVLAVVEEGEARMVGSFKCEKCSDTGIRLHPENNHIFCDCGAGARLAKSEPEVVDNSNEEEDGEHKIVQPGE